MRRRRLRGAWPRPPPAASPRLEDAVGAYVRYATRSPRTRPGRDAYARMQPVFDRLYAHSARRSTTISTRSPPHIEQEMETTMDEILATFRPDLFAGKRVLISGGTSGIGLALAKGFARLGAEVIATGASRARLDAARADSEAKGVRFELLDVRDRKAIDAFVGGFAEPRRADQRGRHRQAREGI